MIRLREHNEGVKLAVQKDRPKRDEFIRSHYTVLEPFLTEEVKARLMSSGPPLEEGGAMVLGGHRPPSGPVLQQQPSCIINGEMKEYQVSPRVILMLHTASDDGLKPVSLY